MEICVRLMADKKQVKREQFAVHKGEVQCENNGWINIQSKCWGMSERFLIFSITLKTISRSEKREKKKKNIILNCIVSVRRLSDAEI